jgi:hypothetical protein
MNHAIFRLLRKTTLKQVQNRTRIRRTEAPVVQSTGAFRLRVRADISVRSVWPGLMNKSTNLRSFALLRARRKKAKKRRDERDENLRLINAAEWRKNRANSQGNPYKEEEDPMTWVRLYQLQ